METADDTRKHWASLLTGQGFLPTSALGPWLALASAALGLEPPAGSAPSAAQPARSETAGAGTLKPGPFGETVKWAALFGPAFKAYAEAFDNMQGLVQNWLAPATENPLSRWLSHPAAVIGGENPPGRLWMEASMALLDFMQSAAAHQGLQVQGWSRALQRFAAEFEGAGDASARSVVVTSLDDLFSHWSSVGEAVLQEHSRSDRFLDSQADMLRKAMRYRVACRRALEAAARANDLPTLTDVDEAFASIHALKREVRELRRAVNDAASRPVAEVPEAASGAGPSAGPGSRA